VYISHDPGLNWLDALPFGWTTDGQPPERWDGLSKRFGFYVDLETGARLGFSVADLSEFDVDDEEHQPIWTGPRFTAPSSASTPRRRARSSSQPAGTSAPFCRSTAFGSTARSPAAAGTQSQCGSAASSRAT
jgi:hypothetical protein